MIFIVNNNLVTGCDWLGGAITFILSTIITTIFPVQLLKDVNSPYPIPEHQIRYCDKVQAFASLENNILLKRFYNAGLAAVLFGHAPIAICYIYYITVNNLASGWDYLIGTVIMALWYVVGICIIINKSFEYVNSPYPFDEVEMNKF